MSDAFDFVIVGGKYTVVIFKYIANSSRRNCWMSTWAESCILNLKNFRSVDRNWR
jgi:hypothetical protein